MFAVRSATLARAAAFSPSIRGAAASWAMRGYASYPSHTVVNMPALSPTMTQGNIGTWKKKIGDQIVPGDVLVEIETDKAQMEFECQDEGYLAKILIDAGAKDVLVNSPIAVMCDEQADVAQFADFKVEAATPAAPAAAAAPAPAAAPVAAAASGSAPAAAAAPSGGRVFASPLAKNLAAQHNMPLGSIAGTGPNSRIIKADVLNAVATGATNAATSTTAAVASGAPAASSAVSEFETPYVDVPLTNMRRVIASRLAESKATVPHYYLTTTIHMDRVLKLREVLNGKLAEGAAGKPTKLSVNDFVIKASAMALREVPAVNAAWWPATNCVREFTRADVCVAVATESGLITPIVRGADTRGLASISTEVKRLAGKAKSNALAPHEYQGGSFTISNLGMFGSVEHFTAIINPPQAAILAVGAMEEKLVRAADAEADANGRVTVDAVQAMKVTLSCDHRVVDGAVSAQWLASFKKFLEDPLQMLL
ncbi:2-oxoacid dehydrogenases acyltransferase-domain-containing protein [Blastocladiella britannica]|nr:2-oxoacid dehydrogenases acyltransferase-domain-containing protein [Blastocladiella britannica]